MLCFSTEVNAFSGSADDTTRPLVGLKINAHVLDPMYSSGPRGPFCNAPLNTDLRSEVLTNMWSSRQLRASCTYSRGLRSEERGRGKRLLWSDCQLFIPRFVPSWRPLSSPTRSRRVQWFVSRTLVDEGHVRSSWTHLLCQSLRDLRRTQRSPSMP